MARLIDADELLRSVDRYFFWSAEDVRRFIATADVVDAVEVVRCKDCMYYKNEEGCKPFCQKFEGLYGYPKEDDFCSYGERKDK